MRMIDDSMYILEILSIVFNSELKYELIAHVPIVAMAMFLMQVPPVLFEQLH